MAENELDGPLTEKAVHDTFRALMRSNPKAMRTLKDAFFQGWRAAVRAHRRNERISPSGPR